LGCAARSAADLLETRGKFVFALIFLFGAIYVVVTVRLVHRIIDELA
jgi:hypothetical protein